MDIDRAIRDIETITFLPGWSVTAAPCDRFQGVLSLTVILPVVNSSNPPEEPGDVYTIIPSFWLVINDLDEFDNPFMELMGRVLEILGDVLMHEAREFFRVGLDHWAPFHPHRVDSMKRWATRRNISIEKDLQYGLADKPEVLA